MLNEICTALGDVKTVPFIWDRYGYGGLHIGKPKQIGKGNFRGKVEEHNNIICHDIRLYENERYVAYFIETRFPTFIDDLKLNVYVQAKNLVLEKCKVVLRKRFDFTRNNSTSLCHGTKSINGMVRPFEMQQDNENVVLSTTFPNIQKILSAYSDHKLEFCILLKVDSYFFLHTELQYEYVCVGEKEDREKIWTLLGIQKIEKKDKNKKITRMQLPTLEEAQRLHQEIMLRRTTRELEYFLNEPTCTVVSENKEVINTNQAVQQVYTVDFLRGEINRKMETIHSLRESGATERDKRFLALLEDPSYMPSKMDLITLILTLNSLTRLDLLTRMMKRFHIPTSFTDPFSYEFRKGDLGVQYKRERIVISTDYHIIPNADRTFFYKTDFEVPVIQSGNDAIYDLSFTIHFDLEEVYECEIKMEAVSIYEPEKYVPFRRIEKNTFTSSVCPHLIIPFGKDLTAKTSIKFVAPIKSIKPLVSAHVSYTEIILCEEISDEWRDAQAKLRLTKKANNVLELTKLENGAVREQQVVLIERVEDMDLRF